MSMIKTNHPHAAHQPSAKEVVVALAHPPWTNRQFWVAQVLVLIVGILHLIGDIANSHGSSPIPGFVWILPLLIPVVYAGITAGIAGALGSAIVGIMLMLPADLLLPHTTTELWGAWSIYVMAIAIAILTGVAVARSNSIIHMEEITEAMAEEEQRFRLAFDDNPTAMAVVDMDGYLLRVNPSACRLLDRTADELTGTSFLDYTHVNDQAIATDLNQDLAAGKLVQVHYTKRLLRKNGDVIYVEIARSLAKDRTGAPRYVIASIRDLTAEIEAARTVTESEMRFRLAFENNMAGMVLHNHDGRFIDANDAFCRIVGFNVEELAANGSSLFLYPEDAEMAATDRQRVLSNGGSSTQNVRRYRHRSGKIIYVEVARSTVRDEDDKPLFTITSVRDITAERTLTEQLSHQALHDSLTGLPNRIALMDRIAHAQQRINRQGGVNALLLFDLDDFKGINDTHGHHIGDQILVALSDRLRGTLRSSDSLCRLAGDEFVYLAEDLSELSDAELLAARLLEALSAPFTIDNLTIQRSASVGVVAWGPPGDRSAIELIRAADTAMYEAKREGKARYVLYTADMGERAATNFRIAQDLVPAISNGELKMYYQPIVNIGNGKIVGWESLMRWRHPEHGWISPDTFIPLAEQNDLILKLGQFALMQSLATASAWPRKGVGITPPYVGINLSARHFHDPDLLPMVESALKTYDFPPECLVIEITESAALLDIESARRVITSLDELGILLALDDFGTGYSSLSYLAKLHPKIIKIDRSFVSPTVKSPYVQRSLEAIISLCQVLKISVIAEGIETPSQLGALQSLGCELGQGFLFSKAVPANEVDHTESLVLNNWKRAIASLETVDPSPL
ncbi:EAL domain-containing protein [Ferrimicrobium acidiphilum]|uniref:EAL domain-containing protein n=1 Tax=Ferrimicrobium acidiphilum TaxID=121039 RepID=UPI0023F30C21|nr:EAL domain-containing protein [Ferrimicrobium acidiphilum]